MLDFYNKYLRLSIIRMSSFVRKQIVEVIRQPRLILILVLGPFLILLLFGIGYRDQYRNINTILVTEPDNPLLEEMKSQIAEDDNYILLQDTLQDKEEAVSILRGGGTGLVIELPVIQEQEEEIPYIYEKTAIVLYHNEINPTEVSYMDYLGRLYSLRVNRQIQINLVKMAQRMAQNQQEFLQQTLTYIEETIKELESGDIQTLAAYQNELQKQGDQLIQSGDNLMLMLALIQDWEDSLEPHIETDLEIEEAYARLDQIFEDFGSMDQGVFQPEEERQTMENLKSELTALNRKLETFSSVSPTTLLWPIRSEVKTVTPQEEYEPFAFFTPAVIVLLIQHIAITFGSLSFLKDRNLGTIELLKVSPTNAMETLLGKYISFMMFTLFIGICLLAAVLIGLGIPNYGPISLIVLTMIGLIFASLGFGFVISLLSNTDSQAIQLSMIFLLLSVFFSGFFVDLRYILESVRTVSWFLPATYGIDLLQNMMLKGTIATSQPFWILFGFGGILFTISWFLLKKELQSR